MTQTHEPETALLQYLDERNIVKMEDVIRHFSHLTFNQVFFAVDRLSRAGKIHLTRQKSFEYAISRVCPAPHHGTHGRDGNPR